MAVRSGFFNSLEGDRKYDANDFSKLFNGIIVDGVFPNVGDKFTVLEDSPKSMAVRVGSGRAFFEGHWIDNDDFLPLTVNAAHPTLKRKDGVILLVDQRDSVRNCSIYIKAGTPAVTPAAVTLYEDVERLEVLLADITIPAGATTISQANIKTYVGTAYCPLVVGAVKTIDIDTHLAQWDAQFNEWFGQLQEDLEGNVAADLTNRVTSLETLKNLTTRIRVVAQHSVKEKGTYTNLTFVPKQLLEVSFDEGNTVANPTFIANGVTYTLYGTPTRPSSGSNPPVYKYQRDSSDITKFNFLADGYTCEEAEYALGKGTCIYKRLANGFVEVSCDVNKGSNLIFTQAGALWKSDIFDVEFPSFMFSDVPYCDGGVVLTSGATAFFCHRGVTMDGAGYVTIPVGMAKTDGTGANYRLRFRLIGRWYGVMA